LNTRTDTQASRPVIGGILSGKFLPVALIALIAFNVAGCGGPESTIDRKAIFGKIVGGEGRSGMLTFLPIDSSIGPAAMCDFEDGAYGFTEVDGPVPGEYNVTVEMEVSDSSASAAPVRRDGRVFKNAAAVGRPTYDEDRTTTASISAEGPLEIDLDITE
jgi:hypothetical protein